MTCTAETAGRNENAYALFGLGAGFALLLGLIALPVLLQEPLLPPAAPTIILGGFLCALSAIDLRTLRLPDLLTLPLLGIGLAVSALAGGEAFMWSLASAAIGGAGLTAVAWIYRRYRNRDGLGFGDVKLFAAAGAWVGAQGLPSVLLVACAAALICVLAYRIRFGRIDAGQAIPFGPFIALGLWTIWLYGPLA